MNISRNAQSQTANAEARYYVHNGYELYERLPAGAPDRLLGFGSDAMGAAEILAALNRPGSGVAEAQAGEAKPAPETRSEFASKMLEALRIAHSRIAEERQIIIESEGESHPDAFLMEHELSVIEAAMARAGAVRDGGVA